MTFVQTEPALQSTWGVLGLDEAQQRATRLKFPRNVAQRGAACKGQGPINRSFSLGFGVQGLGFRVRVCGAILSRHEGRVWMCLVPGASELHSRGTTRPLSRSTARGSLPTSAIDWTRTTMVTTPSGGSDCRTLSRRVQLVLQGEACVRGVLLATGCHGYHAAIGEWRKSAHHRDTSAHSPDQLLQTTCIPGEG